MGEHQFDLVAAKMESLKREMSQRLNADLFRDDGRLSQYPVPRPRPWYVRWGWWLSRYCSTLWKALKGVELEEPSEWD